MYCYIVWWVNFLILKFSIVSVVKYVVIFVSMIVIKCSKCQGMVFNDYFGMICNIFKSMLDIISIVIIRCNRNVI